MNTSGTERLTKVAASRSVPLLAVVRAVVEAGGEKAKTAQKCQLEPRRRDSSERREGTNTVIMSQYLVVVHSRGRLSWR